MKISNWYTVRHHVLDHNWTNKQNVFEMSTDEAQWLACEIDEKNNIKNNTLYQCRLFRLIGCTDYKFYN